MLFQILLITVGLAFLYYGAEWLVKGAADAAIRLGVKPLVVGLTVVAFGTSAPELAVSILAAFRGSSDVAIGNVVGSNIGNLGLILGVVALLSPVAVKAQLLKLDIPVMIWSAVLLMFMLVDREITRVEGLVLASLLIVYVYFTVRESKKGDLSHLPESAPAKDLEGSMFKYLAFVAFGVSAMVFGASLLVNGAVTIAKAAGISEAVIGLTMVAIGTSLPEMAASIVASIRKQGDIALGNVIGSNIFNVFSVVGLSAMVMPIKPLEIKPFDLGVMMLFSVAIIPAAWHRNSISRVSGGLLLIGYIFYLGYLFNP